MALTLGDLYIQHHVELLQRTSLLLTHARYARLTARYIGLLGGSERMGVVEASVATHEARLLKTLRAVQGEVEALRGSSAEGIDAWTHFVSRRLEHNDEVAASLDQLRQIQRVVSQESVASPTGVTPPTVFHGINQHSFLSTTSDVAEHYYRAIAEYANRSVLGDAPLSIELGDVLVVHSHHPFPRQQSYAHADSPRRSVIARMPVWYGYTTRFHPNIAHEMAHPVVHAADESTAASAGPFRGLKRSFEVAIAKLFGEVIGRNRVLGFANLERVILDECLSDVLALRVAGPSYLASLAVSVAGTRPLSKVQALEPPLSVRVRVLLTLANRWYPEESFPTWHGFADLLRRYLAHYDEWLKAHDAAPKLAYQRLLHRVVSEYVDGAVEAWHLDQPPAAAGAAEALGPRFRDYVTQQLALEEFKDVRSPAAVVDYEHTLRTQAPLAVGPNIIWLTYLNNPAYLRSGPEHLPEGRLFHEWCRLVKEGDRTPPKPDSEGRAATFQFGTYWEFLFFSVLWPSIQGATDDLGAAWPLHDLVHDIISPSDPPPPVEGPRGIDGKFSVIGGFDILTLRKGYQAKVAEPQWPPVHRRYAYFTHRHLVQEVTAAKVGNTEWRSELQRSLDDRELLACVQVKYTPGTPLVAVLEHVLHWRAVRGDVVGIFRSLHWEDVILLLRVSDLSKLLALSSWRADAGGVSPHRTLTQLLLPVDEAGAASPLSRVGASTPVRLSVHGRIANPDRIEHVRKQIAESVHKDSRQPDVLLCLGQDDLIATVEVRTGRDLEGLLQTLCTLKSRGDLLATSTRILAAAHLMENIP